MPTLTFAQIENRWQPDSVYVDKNVKRIYVYLNSPKDLSEVVDFDKSGKRIRSVKYSASYNRTTRNHKRIESVKLYYYDSLERLISIVDTVETYSIIYQYGTDGRLDSSIKKLGNFVYFNKYFHDPFKVTTTQMKDSTVVYEKTKEYERDFYVKRFYGYYLEPKLKRVQTTIDGETNTTAYSDYEDLERFDEDQSINNTFDSNGKLIKSEVRSVFMNDRINEYELYYKYDKDGLLKSVRGYLARHFEYSYWK